MSPMPEDYRIMALFHVQRQRFRCQSSGYLSASALMAQTSCLALDTKEC